MDQTHLGYTGWRDPPENTLEAVTLERLSIPIRESFGVAVEGSGNSWPGSHEEAVLPSFDNLNDQEHYIELFRTGTMPCPFKITSSSKWISISENNGILDHDKRIMVSILWDKIKSAHATGNIIIESPGIEVKVGLTVDKYTAPSGIKAFIESNGYISIEADHFNRKTDSESGKWIRIENYGHTHAGMRAIINPDAPLPETNALPCLEYDVYTFRDGQVYVDPVFAPSLNFIAGRPVRYAISFDDEEPQVITLVPQDFDARNGNREWEQSVSDNFRKGHSVHVLSAGGSHVLKIRVLDPGIVLQKIVVNTGGLRPSYLGPPESIFLEN